MRVDLIGIICSFCCRDERRGKERRGEESRGEQTAPWSSQDRTQQNPHHEQQQHVLSVPVLRAAFSIF
jgi:hypothetical protein